MSEMEEPCVCVCGFQFELEDGHPCGHCFDVFCTDCVNDPFDMCPKCEAWSKDD